MIEVRGDIQEVGRDDICVPPNTQVEVSSPRLVKYRTTSSVDNAMRFYQTEMPKNGWRVSEGHLIKPDTAVLYYIKSREMATVIITQGGRGRTKVMISIAEEWPSASHKREACGYCLRGATAS
jgi:hypothetical protein